MLIFSVLIYVLRPKKDYFIFPECLSELEKCPPEKKARLIAFFNNYMEGDFQEKQLVQWKVYYDEYKQDIDFCFIMSHNDTSYFNAFIHKIGFTAPFVYDVNDCFVEKLSTTKSKFTALTMLAYVSNSIKNASILTSALS